MLPMAILGKLLTRLPRAGHLSDLYLICRKKTHQQCYLVPRKEMSETPVLDDRQKQQRYESLVDALYQDVYRYAYWLCKNGALAEDLVQETFLRAWRSLDSLQNDKAAKAWLFTILRRENARLYERYRPDLVDIEDQSLMDSVDNEPDQRMDRKLLHDAIASLEKDYREPLLLQVIGGFSGKEIAEILDLNNNTVMTRLFRARGKLKHVFFPDGDPDAGLDEPPDE
ncbi:MAG: sigma-70 family RNA polymerase sigma factor [Pseudomonadales bacterium]|nr:sigma-70 family RNA polymerase sigma factor [Pseudomonadales bacterium]